MGWQVLKKEKDALGEFVSIIEEKRLDALPGSLSRARDLWRNEREMPRIYTNEIARSRFVQTK